MAQQPFDPNQFISKVKGQDYLEVKHRIAWMRSEFPEAAIATELVSHADGRAIMRASVALPSGGSSSGYGSETAASFENYIEKAETKAIGRALTALGYGTPGAIEHEDDEPDISFRQAAPQPMTQPNAFLATAPQRSRIQRLAAELQIQPDELNALILQHVGVDFSTMNKRQASGIIDLLEARRPVSQRAS